MAAKVVGPGEGKAGFLGSIGVRFMIDGDESSGGFSLVEHPMSPWALAAPLHRHAREDEYSFVLEGRMGALLGDEELVAGPGDLVFKPRNQWHTFWNAGDEPARILEIISPAGFEKYFDELVELGGPEPSGRRRWESSAPVTSSTWTRRAFRASLNASVSVFPESRSRAPASPRRPSARLGVLELIGVAQGPADPLDQQGARGLGLEIGRDDPLAVYLGGSAATGSFGRDDYLGHSGLLLLM